MRFIEDLLSDPKNGLIFLALLGGLVINHFKLLEPKPRPQGG